MIKAEKIAVLVRDTTGQNKIRTRVSSEVHMGEAVENWTNRMDLPLADSSGRSLTYQARVESRGEGRHLNPSEIAGEVLAENDEVSLHPDISAGGR